MPAKNSNSETNEQKKYKNLQTKLGYQFKNIRHLIEALTRESAIQEKIPGAAERSYQALEFLGDAALKHAIARILYDSQHGKVSEDKLHDQAKKLIANDSEAMEKIAKELKLSQYIIKGKGEEKMTPKMEVDALEAILGAISIDNASSKNQGAIFNVIERLWDFYIKAAINSINVSQINMVSVSPSTTTLTIAKADGIPKESKMEASTPIVAKTSTTISPFPSKPIPQKTATQTTSATSTNENTIVSRPLSPNTQRMFSSLIGNTPIDKFKKNLSKAPDINRQNQGKIGDTALMTLLRKKILREDKEIPRIEALLRYGALWSAPNRKGETANDLAKNHDQVIIAKLKNITTLKK